MNFDGCLWKDLLCDWGRDVLASFVLLGSIWYMLVHRKSVAEFELSKILEEMEEDLRQQTLRKVISRKDHLYVRSNCLG